jgi:hypothetical protein
MNQGCITPTAYDDAEKWANEMASDHGVIFNPKRFHEAIKESARDIHVPEVVSAGKRDHTMFRLESS